MSQCPSYDCFSCAYEYQNGNCYWNHNSNNCEVLSDQVDKLPSTAQWFYYFYMCPDRQSLCEDNVEGLSQISGSQE